MSLRDKLKRVLRMTVECGALDSLSLRDRRIESSRDFCKSGHGAVPSQFINVIEERNVGPERGESSK